jgi:hypothetical protein
MRALVGLSLLLVATAAGVVAGRQYVVEPVGDAVPQATYAGTHFYETVHKQRE